MEKQTSTLEVTPANSERMNVFTPTKYVATDCVKSNVTGFDHGGDQSIPEAS